MTHPDDRADREVEHGKWLASGNAEETWGWATPAGSRRASRRARLIAEAACLSPGRRVMEVGCGTGLFTAVFAASGASLLATDVSDALLERARSRGLPANVELKVARFEDLTITETFDAVIGSSVLHHLDLNAALGQIARLLRPGGLITFAEPNMLNPQIFLERHARSLFPYVSPDETAFTRWSLARKLRMHGFSDIRIVPFDWLHPATPGPACAIVDATGRLLERAPGVREFAGSLLISGRKL